MELQPEVGLWNSNSGRICDMRFQRRIACKSEEWGAHGLQLSSASLIVGWEGFVKRLLISMAFIAFGGIAYLLWWL